MFVRMATAPLYALDVAPPVGWIGYFGTQDSSASRLSLDDAWRGAGTYLFGRAAPADLGWLGSALAKAHARGSLRAAWIAGTDARPVLIGLHAEPRRPNGIDPWHVTRRCTLAYGDYRLALRPGALLSPAAAPGFGIAADADHVSFGLDAALQPVPGSVLIPFVGDRAGAFAATLHAPAGRDAFADLGVALRYQRVERSVRPSEVQTIRMPVLRQPARPLRMALAFDVLRPVDPERTSLTFDHRPQAVVSFLSGFTTIDGFDVQLAPASLASVSPARLVFSRTRDPLGRVRPYLSPDGPFRMTTGGGRAALALGPSGLEYADANAPDGVFMLFRAGQPAFAPGTGPALLTSRATTSYLTVLPADESDAGFTYFAQPPEAPLFRDLPGEVLEPGRVASGILPRRPEAASCATIPVGAPRWLAPTDAAAYLALERAALAPRRRELIPAVPDLAAALALDGQEGALVTPQGFVIETGSAGAQIRIAAVPNADPSELVLTSVGSELGGALQASQSFVVVADPSVFFGGASIRYQLSERQIERLPIPKDAREALNRALGPLYREYETEREFSAVAEKPAGESWDVVRACAGRLIADVSGWRFDLSPRAWRTAGATRTVMLIKFASSALNTLIADPARWSWQAAAGDVAATKRLVEGAFAAAADAPPGSPLAAFSSEIASNPAWNGVLILNAPIVVEDLPADLRFVHAGTRPGEFYAHHVALALTPVGPGQTSASPPTSAIGALVAYDDRADLVMESDVPFAFKAFSLMARFANGAIAGFDAEVELMVNRLFGEALRKEPSERGNNLVLRGTYQQVDAMPTYAFSLQTPTSFLLDRSALQAITVSAVRLQTATTGLLEAQDFMLSGSLAFRAFPGADVFAFDDLRFSNLRIRMASESNAPAFEVDAGALALDPLNSLVRPNSLVARFPARISRVIAVSAATAATPKSGPAGPQALGFAPVLAPIKTVALEPPWYGLVYDVDLGSTGPLGGNAPLSLQLLAAWAPGDDAAEPPVFLGANAGGAMAGGWSFQGVLRLGFKTFQLLVGDREVDGVTTRDFGLRLGRFGLGAFGVSVPPGRADLFLFGSSAADGSTSLGWYAAYAAPTPNAAKPT